MIEKKRGGEKMAIEDLARMVGLEISKLNTRGEVIIHFPGQGSCDLRLSQKKAIALITWLFWHLPLVNEGQPKSTEEVNHG